MHNLRKISQVSARQDDVRSPRQRILSHARVMPGIQRGCMGSKRSFLGVDGRRQLAASGLRRPALGLLEAVADSNLEL